VRRPIPSLRRCAVIFEIQQTTNSKFGATVLPDFVETAMRRTTELHAPLHAGKGISQFAFSGGTERTAHQCRRERPDAAFNNRVIRLKKQAGMHQHQIASLGAIFLNEPGDVLEHAFQFFDVNPEVPALLLFTADGGKTSAMTGDMSRQLYWA
jgi:hypothetical protein